MIVRNNDMKEMDFSPQQIKIMLIPPFNAEAAPVPLTLDTIYHPELKNKKEMAKNPYITSVVKYPTELIDNIRRQGYKTVVSFFFNKKKFESLLRSYNKSPSSSSSNKILEYNTMVMLKTLFPTYYPSVENVSTSYNTHILQSGKNLSANVAWRTLFSKNQLSYILIDGKKYTITKTVLLNDLLNNPIYKNVIEKYTEYVNSSNLESEKIDKELKNGIQKLIYRFDKDENDKQGNLNISIYADRFVKIDQTKEPTPTGTFNPYIFNSNIDKMINSITQIYNLFGRDALKKSTNINKFIRSFNESIRNIQDLYKLIVELKLMTTFEFSKNVDELVKESNNLNTMSIVQTEYIGPKNINVKLDEQKPEITNLLRTKYKFYTNFMDVINSIIYPSRESTNDKLQESINNYSQNQNTGDRFNHIIENVSEKYMYKPIQSNMKHDVENLKDYMNIGINRINGAQYEIYVSMDLIENEYNIDNIKNLDCKYQGVSLGTDAENMENPYILHSVFLSQSEINKTDNDNDKIVSTSTGSNPATNPPNPATNPPANPPANPPNDAIKKTVGGRKSQKYMNKKRRKLKNTRRKGRK